MSNDIKYSPIVNQNIYNNDFSNSTTNNQEYQISIDPLTNTMAKVIIIKILNYVKLCF